jgi:regulator of sirC expression with transglutaminase-like and TPR domain
LARDEYPDLDAPVYLARLDSLAADLRPRLVGSLSARTAELAHFLFEEQGFAGNADDYYDPRNSYLSDVLDRRLGIPITLSVLAMAVGARAGLTVAGVGLPGHFVAKASDASGHDILFDPFHGGQFLDADGCEQLVAAVTGHPFTLTARAVAATPPGLIAVRMLNNLKAVYLRDSDFVRAARVMERLVQLGPGDPVQRRDLGVSLVHAGKPGRAIGHLRLYLDHVPSADDAEAVRGFLDRATAEVARWN